MWHNVQFRGAGQMRPAPAAVPVAGTDPPIPRSTEPGPIVSAIRAGQLVERLNSAQTARSAADLLQQLGQALSAEANANGAWLAVQQGQPGQTQRGWQFLPLLDQQDNPLWNLVSSHAGRLAAEAASNKQQAAATLESLGQLVACPATGQAQNDEVLVVCFPPATHSIQAGLVTRLATSAIQQWRQARMIELAGEQAQMAQRLNVLGQSLATATSAETAGVTAVNQLQQLLGASQVLLANQTGVDRCRVASVSGLESFDPGSPTLKTAESVIQACQGTGPVWFPAARATADEEVDPASGNGLAEWLRDQGFQSGAVFRDARIGRAAFLVAFAEPPGETEAATRRLVQVLQFAAAQLELVQHRFELPGARLIRRTRDVLRQRPAKAALAVLAGLGILLLMPFPARIGCATRLEPVSRRFVAAPFEATLERSLVRNGDSVRAGDVLAVLDGRKHRMEEAGLEAELAAARKKRDSSLAGGNIADSQMAKKDCLRIEARLAQVRQELNELEIRSPVDGIVVSGDLDTAEGVSLTLGQTLFEIGPLDRIRAEILVPETDIRHVREAADVRVRLESWPFASWQGTVTRIHQRSEIIDEQNCFVAEVEIPNPDGRLRPGMKGHAGIAAGWKPLGWIWLHRAWDRMRYLLVW